MGSKKKERRKRRIQINLGISLVGSSLSLMFMDHLELTAVDRLSGKCILRNKPHSVLFIVFQMIPTLPLQKVSLLYNQTKERVLKVIYLVFFVFRTFRKLRHLGNIVILPTVFQSKV